MERENLPPLTKNENMLLTVIEPPTSARVRTLHGRMPCVLPVTAALTLLATTLVQANDRRAPARPERPIATMETIAGRGAPCRGVEAAGGAAMTWRCAGAASGYLPVITPSGADDVLSFRLEGRVARSTGPIVAEGMGRLTGRLRWYWRPGQGEHPPAVVLARFADGAGAPRVTVLIGLHVVVACVAALAAPEDEALLHVRALELVSAGADGFRCGVDTPEVLGARSPLSPEQVAVLHELARIERAAREGR